MKKYSFLLVVLMQSVIGLGQAPIKTDLPTIIPPSPTVAALMKFEEVPVSNYTGIPDISIPLFNSPTLSKDVTLAISLKYHPSGVAADERASDVGLGWSLFAGGTISRTVRGLPDEIFELGDNEKIGLYKDESTINHKNNYYQAFNYIYDYFEGEMDSIPTEGFDKMDEYLWNSQVRGAYDTEHDLWQFNFMGQAGRFYIRKNESDELEVVPLDDYRVKIINHYVTATNNKYKPTSFAIFDEKGYQYVFDVIETTSVSSLVEDVSSTTYESDVRPGTDYSYDSSFHLSKIYDTQGNVLVDLIYNETAMHEKVMDGSTTYYQEDYLESPISIRDFYLMNACMASVNQFTPYPIHTSTGNEKDTVTKKLEQIKVTGIAKVNFIYSQGRSDENIFNPGECYAFKGIEIKDWNGAEIKKVTLDQGYSETKLSRMILEKVSFQNYLDSKEEKYELFYRGNLNPYSASTYIGKDYWGYFNLKPSLGIDGFYKEAAPVFCTTETLQKMVLPTGGCVIFDFEPNTYSYIGNEALTDFDANPNNWDQEDWGTTLTTVLTNHDVFSATDFTIPETQDVFFKANITTTDGTGEYYIKVWKVDTTPNTVVGQLHLEDDFEDEKLFIVKNLLPGTYKVSIMTTNGAPFTFESAQIYAFYKTRNENDFQFLYGGGNRINKIGYFEDGSVPQNYYQDSSSLVPQKEKKFEYDLFIASDSSSGSLAFDVPKFNYRKYKKECPHCEQAPIFSGGIPTSVTWKNDDDYGWYYDVRTTFNNLNPVKTQGADVGYQNVRVSEIGNGHTDFTYTSPINFPEVIGEFNLATPFMPTENYDYKRGLPVKEAVYAESGRVLNDVEYNYEYENHIEITGFKTFYPVYDFINLYGHKFYADYKNYIESCGQHPSFLSCNSQELTDNRTTTCDCFCYFGKPRDFIVPKFIKEAYGWAKLISKTNKNYFYDASDTQKTVQTDETYTYHDSNKQIDEQTVSNSLGETLKTKYYYLETVDNAYSENNIAMLEKVETYKADALLSTSQINYSTGFTGNLSYLPETIATAKADQTLEPRVRYTKYDAYGHPLELQQENGTTICYIWGYHKTQPIAKIENVSYETIDGELINTAQIASNSSLTGIESGLLSALTAIRTTLPNAMVTTYTYIPLVGVSTITDPKGYITTYQYDTFGRLSNVKDAEDNILSANEYHYKN